MRTSYSNFIEGCIGDLSELASQDASGKKNLNKIRSFNSVEIALILFFFLGVKDEDKEEKLKKHIREGKFREEEEMSFITSNPLLLFFQFFLSHQDTKNYHRGFFSENVKKMCETIVNLNLFFIKAFIVYNVLNSQNAWEHIPSHISMRINNFIEFKTKRGKWELTLDWEEW